MGMSLLSPRSIAVIGASATEGKVGHDILKNLATQGYEGAIYPVNPKGGEILGKRAYASVRNIPEPVDLAIIVTPGPTVLGLLGECAKKKIPSVIVISAGFSELGTDAGRQDEEEVRAMAKKYEIELVGVNCLGVIRTANKMNASFAKDMPPRGHVGFISQSGALAVAVMDASADLQLGYSFVVSIGNKTVMDECDFLDMAEHDRETHVVGMYLESIKDGPRFLQAAARVARKKPIVLLKSGVSEQGKRAACSHTGALAGSDAGIDAACRQTGMHRARSAAEFIDLLRVLGSEPPLVSPRIAIITNAGGPGILATDAAEADHLTLIPLSPIVFDKLKAALPVAASIRNPVDVLGDAGADRYAAALTACGDDPGIDGVAVLMTPQVMTPGSAIADVVIDFKRRFPLTPVVTCFFGGPGVSEAVSMLSTRGIMNFDTPERAVHALAMLRPVSPSHGRKPAARKRRSAERISETAGQAHSLLSPDAAAELLKLSNLPTPAQALAATAKEAAAIAERMGFPVIAKIASPQILHKTDIGGVRANLASADAVAQAFTEIMANVKKAEPEAKVDGVLIQQFLPVGHEFIVGALRDPSFGHLIMVGLGGIYTELFKDVTFRIAPIDEEEAYRMLQDLRAWPLLLGMRGKPQSDIDALADLLVKTSILAVECPGLRELDFNPVLVSEGGVTIADAKIVLR
ncbi:MAG: acetyl-CoA synthetase (ADP-forming), alpha and beta subunit fusion [Candidatus Peregrinibacteria bacterium Greene0416_19]|nr:MAG: acetyl-CoA synthetase (ADP-forming), alpha and beta subunit fusion [Candidatus Peregrinibacteria bacterium Greene0416_19]